MAVSWPWILTTFLAPLYQMSGYICGHIDIQKLEMSPVFIVIPSLEASGALIDRGVWVSSEECLVY